MIASGQYGGHVPRPPPQRQPDGVHGVVNSVEALDLDPVPDRTPRESELFELASADDAVLPRGQVCEAHVRMRGCVHFALLYAHDPRHPRSLADGA